MLHANDARRPAGRWYCSVKNLERKRRYNRSPRGIERQRRYRASRVITRLGGVRYRFPVPPERRDEIMAVLAAKRAEQSAEYRAAFS
jgi:hypothetical protein